ncbi:MAG: hypothetical protein L0Z62_05975 [Gemmataceae bacterium]|nr:hypothetical protein [Gemmataceae bacterium]
MASDRLEHPHHLLTALLQLVQALERRRLRYALIGGVATGYRSRPRFTLDLDFLLDVPQGQLPGLLADLQARGFDFDLETTLRQWTREHLTVLSFHEVRIDWLKPLLPLYQHVIDRARPEPWLGQSIHIAAPEGLILTKLLAFRTQDQIDIENILAANRGQLDLDLIQQEWQTVAGLDDPRMQRFQDMVSRLYRSPAQAEPVVDPRADNVGEQSGAQHP